VARTLAGDLPQREFDIGRVAFTRHGGQRADVPGYGATKHWFSGWIPDSAVDHYVQLALTSQGCLGTCAKVQIFAFDGTSVRSTCVSRGQVFHASDLVDSPDPPCL
jgi:hypothetical protein